MTRRNLLDMVIDVSLLVIIAAFTVTLLSCWFDRDERETLDRINRQREVQRDR